jgi:MFS family permease
VTGPLLAGWLADRYGFGTSFVVAAAVALVPLAFVAAARGDRAIPAPAHEAVALAGPTVTEGAAGV